MVIVKRRVHPEGICGERVGYRVANDLFSPAIKCQVGAATDFFMSFTSAFYGTRDIAGALQILVEQVYDRRMDGQVDRGVG